MPDTPASYAPSSSGSYSDVDMRDMAEWQAEVAKKLHSEGTGGAPCRQGQKHTSFSFLFWAAGSPEPGESAPLPLRATVVHYVSLLCFLQMTLYHFAYILSFGCKPDCAGLPVLDLDYARNRREMK